MTKRQCAGCHRVLLDGRSDRIWCSDACRQRGYRQQQDRRPLGPVPSVIRGSNGVLIATVARLGYVDGPMLDLTYGRGAWWKLHTPPNGLVIFDGDFTRTGLAANSQRGIAYDPPYISTGNEAASTIPGFYEAYGLGELKGWRAVRALIDDGLVECARILMPGGFLLVKCMDYTESGHKVWNTFHVYSRAEALGLRLADRFVHVTGVKAQPRNNLDGSPRQQQHAREVSSMLFVFTK
jgi:hypothetical protein